MSEWNGAVALERVAALERERDDYRQRYESLLERTEPPRPHQQEALCELTARGFTEREAQIAQRISRGLSDKEIASDLGISLATVRTHVHRAFRKLGVDNRVKLALLVLRVF
jgi:DNA-binding NarL/FixJ family response regulator